MPNATAPMDAGFYTHWSRENIRQNDTDWQAHVNHAVITTYFEIGRIGMFAARSDASVDDGVAVVIRKLTIEYLKELRYPGTVEIGSRGIRLGTSSFTIAQALFKDGECIATAEAVCVFLDAKQRKPWPISQNLRGRLTAEWRL